MLSIYATRTLVALGILVAGLSATASTRAGAGAAASAGTYFVSATGSDANPCSQLLPCKTFQRAADVASSGDTVSVACGVYPKQTIRRDTHIDAYVSAVTFKSASRLCASVSGIVLGANNGSASGNAPSHLSFSGFDIPNGAWAVISTTCANNTLCPPYASDVSLLSSHIHGTMPGGPLVNIGGSTTSITVAGNELGPFCCNSDGIGIGKVPVQTNPVNVTIDHNYVHDIQDSCNPSRWTRTFSGCSGQGFGDGSAAPCFPGCDHVDGLQAFGATNLVISDNVWTNAGSQNIFLQTANGGSFNGVTLTQNMVNPAACSCATNSVSLAGPGTSVFHGQITIDYNTFQKNLLVYDLQRGSKVLGPDARVDVTGNIVGSGYHDMPSSRCTFTAGDGSTIAPRYSHNVVIGTGTPLCSPSDTQGRPTFLDPRAHSTNLHLAAGSYGIGLGDPARFPRTDIDGDVRYALAVDAGADQTPRTAPAAW